MIPSSTWQLDWQALSRHGLRRNKIFQSILFPVDFSSACKTTATYVRDLAELTGGTVTLLHVAPSRSAWYGAADVHSGMDGHETLAGLKKAQLSALATLRHEFFNGVPCQIALESGSVAERILDYAEHASADLIMMTTRGTGNPGRCSMGSVTAAVLRDPPCAVWTSPHSDQLKPFTRFHSIVCAIAPDCLSREYVNETTALGAVFGSRVMFVSAVATTPGAFGDDPRISSLKEEYPDAGLDGLVAGSRCKVYVETGPVGYVVRHVAQTQGADLVVINRRHGPPGLDELETHAYEIVLESPCPVLTLPIRATAASINIPQESYRQEEYTFAKACC